MKRPFAPHPDQGALLVIDGQGGLALAPELATAVPVAPFQREAAVIDWSTSGIIPPNGRALLQETGGAVDLDTHYVHLLDSLRSVGRTNSNRGYLQVRTGSYGDAAGVELGQAVSSAEASQRNHFFIAQGLGAIANAPARVLTPTQSKALAAVNDLHAAFKRQFVTPTPLKERQQSDGSPRPDQVRSRRNAYIKKLEDLVANPDGNPGDTIALKKVRYCPNILSVCAPLLPVPK